MNHRGRVAREHPAENQDELITMAELLNAPIKASQSTTVEEMDLDM